MSNWTEDDYDEDEDDRDNWEDDVPDCWWADDPSECAEEQYLAAKP